MRATKSLDNKTPVQAQRPIEEALETGKIICQTLGTIPRNLDAEDREEIISELETGTMFALYYSEIELTNPEIVNSNGKRITEDAGIDTLKDLKSLPDFFPIFRPELLG